MQKTRKFLFDKKNENYELSIEKTLAVLGVTARKVHK
jgi:ribosomal protein S2